MSDQMNDQNDPLAKALRADAARVAPRVPPGLAERAKAAVRAEQLAPKRIRFVPWLAVAAAAAGFAIGVIVFAGHDEVGPPSASPIAFVPQPRPVKEVPTPSEALDLAGALHEPTAPLDQEIARMQGDARAAMGFLLDALPVAKKD
jgi:hypothetical protein